MDSGGSGPAAERVYRKRSVLTQNTTEGLNMVINGLPWRQE